jgi:hypothetical protein
VETAEGVLGGWVRVVELHVVDIIRLADCVVRLRRRRG